MRGALQPAIDEHFFKAVMEREDEAQFYAGLHQDRVRFQTERRRRPVQQDIGEG